VPWEVTTYTAGIGIDLNEVGSERSFEIDEEYLTKNTPDCSAGQFATGFGPTGTIQCEAPPTAQGVQGFSTTVGFVILAGETTVISKTLPAGTYLLFASVELQNEDNDSTSNGECSMPGYRAQLIRLNESSGFEPGFTESISMTSAITHPGGPVVLTCEERSADVNVFQATLSAIKLSSVG